MTLPAYVLQLNPPASDMGGCAIRVRLDDDFSRLFSPAPPLENVNGLDARIPSGGSYLTGKE